jgi:hypothetical protein
VFVDVHKNWEKYMIQMIEYLKLNSISKDQKFNLNSNIGINALKESIASVGIIYPLLVWKNDNSILLIDGFKRFQIAKNLGETEAPFIFISSDFSLYDVIKIRYYNLKQEDIELNAYLKFSIYRLLKEAHVTNNILYDWQRILNLFNPEKIQKILNWPKIARDYIYNYNVSTKQLLFLLNQDLDVIEEIFSLATSLSIRIVELNKIVEMISEIALNDNVSIISILKRNIITSIIEDENLNRNQKILKLKKVFYEWRYPIITEFQKQFIDQLKMFSFKENTQIQYDKSFEKPEVILSTKLRNNEDLDCFIDLITNKSNIKALKNILSYL